MYLRILACSCYPSLMKFHLKFQLGTGNIADLATAVALLLNKKEELQLWMRRQLSDMHAYMALLVNLG